MVPCLRTSSSSLQGQRIISCVFLGSSIAGFLLLEHKLFGSRFCKLATPGLMGHIGEGLLLICSSVCVDVGACACTCVCTCVEAEIAIGCLWLLSLLILWGRVSHLNAKLTNSDSLASQLVLEIPFFTSQMPSLQVGHHAHTAFTLLLVVSKLWVQSWAKYIHSYIITYIHTALSDNGRVESHGELWIQDVAQDGWSQMHNSPTEPSKSYVYRCVPPYQALITLCKKHSIPWHTSATYPASSSSPGMVSLLFSVSPLEPMTHTGGAFVCPGLFLQIPQYNRKAGDDSAVMTYSYSCREPEFTFQNPHWATNHL